MAIEQSRFRADASPAIVSSRAPSSFEPLQRWLEGVCDGPRGVIPRAQYVIAAQRVELLMVPIRDGVTLIRRR
jgi:hypothetical protein